MLFKNLFMLLTLVYSCSATAYVCPCDSKYFDGHCYYISPRTAKNWPAARATCRARGGDLAVPTSKINNLHIFQAMKASNVHKAFIGLYKVADGLGTNTFYTVRGVEPTYTNWYPGQPSDSGGNEDCGEMLPAHSTSGGDVGGQWNDLPCNDRFPRHYVCQTSFQFNEN
ncbi:Hypothetical predicted protein [Paramuricea clavata]|uniref:Uncharacterized protein n=2 Tax=Paramuricea clavata TaxID=317549 RepID=A0A7D9E8S6_PARCT|nr:Hypothetical predicted protein [Paramuricea clavata]